jgi:hypothetical protein
MSLGKQKRRKEIHESICKMSGKEVKNCKIGYDNVTGVDLINEMIRNWGGICARKVEQSMMEIRDCQIRVGVECRAKAKESHSRYRDRTYGLRINSPALYQLS